MADLSGTFKDIDGNYSSKRVAAFVALGCIVVAFVADLLGHHPSEFIVNDLMLIVGGGFLGAVAERFAPRQP